MDRNEKDQVELFRAFTVEEIRDRENDAALISKGSIRGENSSSGGLTD